MFKSRSLCWAYSSLLITTLYTLLACPIHSWAKCPSPLAKRLELGGGSNQASALETAQATQVYFMYAQRALLPTLSPIHAKTSPTCDQHFQLSYGITSAYGQAQENSLVWSVLHQELELKLIIESAWRYGVGTIGLQAGIGALWLNESQERLQASRLNPDMLVDNAQATVILSREGQQVLPLFTFAPVVRLQFIEATWGELGLSTQFKVDYRLLNPDIPQAVSSWGWGIQFGLFVNFGQVLKPVQADQEHK